MDVIYCKAQHEVLRSFIGYILQFWGPRHKLPLSYWIDDTAYLAKHPSRRHTTRELNFVLKRAMLLSQDCCRPLPPLRAALVHAKRYQAFTDILKEVQWCVSVENHGRSCYDVKVPSALELREFPFDAQVGQQEQLMLKEAEQEDWRDLMCKLEDWWEDHECSAEECGNEHGRSNQYYCLAAQMLREWSTKGSIRNISHHLCKLWSFDESVLKYGRPLGSGACGGVTEATWMGNMYAEKKFQLPEHCLQPEAEALSKLNHPHIVKVHACSEDSLLLDLMSTDLQKFIRSRMQGGRRDQPFSLPAATDLMLQIADAVSYLHSQRMVHRDLKPANILVDPVMAPDDGLDEHGFVFAKVADFGLAKVKHEVTRFSHLTLNMGTRVYMAPEIFGAKKEDDHLESAYPMKMDVYSFGIICSEILTGESPFKGVPLSSLYKELTNTFPLRPRLPTSCPTSLVSLISACWNADPRERPTFVDVCRVLRYLRGVQILKEVGKASYNAIDEIWPYGRLPAIKTVFLDDNGEEYLPDGNPLPNMDIMGVQLVFSDFSMETLSGITIASSSRGERIETFIGHHEEIVSRSDWIEFDHPSEYLIQVEGLQTGTSLSCISFITTLRKYGPYGKFISMLDVLAKSDRPRNTKFSLTRNIISSPTRNTKYFSSSRGRVVGFIWDYFLVVKKRRIQDSRALRVDALRDITKCLNHFLSLKNRVYEAESSLYQRR